MIFAGKVLLLVPIYKYIRRGLPSPIRPQIYISIVCDIESMSIKRKEALHIKASREFMYGDLNRDRTCDPHPVKMVLSQLSYQVLLVRHLIVYQG